MQEGDGCSVLLCQVQMVAGERVELVWVALHLI